MNVGNGTTTTIVNPVQTTVFTTTESLHVFASSERLLLGVVLAVTGNLLISVAMNIQKYSHNQLIESGGSYVKSPTWWGGLILMILGEVGNFSAYGFAPASLVAPLGTTTVIANAIIAFVFLKEQLRHRDVLGVALAIIGAFLLVNFSTKSDTMLTSHEIIKNLKQWPFLVYLIIEVGVFVLVLYLHHTYDFAKVVTILLQVAILGSLTVISAKAVSSMLTLSFRGLNQLTHPIFYVMLLVMIATAVGQVKFLNQAMALYDTTVVVPTNFVFFTMSAILSGIVFYQEFYGMVFLEIFMFLFGAFLSFGGVYMITGGRKEKDPQATSEESQELLPRFPTVTESILRIQPEDVMTTRIFTDSDDHINTPLHVT